MPTKHRYRTATGPMPTPIGTTLRLRILRVARIERPEVAEINVRLVPIERELARLSEEEQVDAIREAEKLTARSFFLDRRSGTLELSSDFLRQLFTIEESGAEFRYNDNSECHTISCKYEYVEDV